MDKKTILILKILILGSNGQLGRDLAYKISKFFKTFCYNKDELDITNFKKTSRIIKKVNPDIIINASAYTLVDQAERKRKLAYNINANAVKNLAKISNKINSWLIHYSTDYVFDGCKKSSYNERDKTNPINIYGKTKLGGERFIIKHANKYIILRTSWVVGRNGNNFIKNILKLAMNKTNLNVINDQVGVPTSTNLIAKVTINIARIINKNKPLESGVYHLAPLGSTNWYKMAIIIIKLAKNKLPIKLNEKNIKAIKSCKYKTFAKRPLNSKLNCKKLRKIISFSFTDWKKDFVILSKQIIRDLKYD